MQKFKVTEEKIRLDSFLTKELNVSRSFVKTAIESDGAIVNGLRRNKSGFELKSGDCVEFELPRPKIIDLEPAQIKLDIVYEDEFFAVINKPQGMVVHPALSHTSPDTLVNALLFNLDSLSSINGVIRPGIVHRLDKNTSGLIVVAKNDEAHRSLAKQIESKKARRIYFALVDGNVKEDEGKINAPIGRNIRDRKKMAVAENGRAAQTLYKTIERFGKYSFMQFELKTGRTHQIRVHMKYIGHPVVGDDTYGGSQTLVKGAQMLHAAKLILFHPKTGEEMSFEAPLPIYFSDILEKLRKSK